MRTKIIFFVIAVSAISQAADEGIKIDFVVGPLRDVFAEAEAQHKEFSQVVGKVVTHATEIREVTQNEVRTLARSVSAAGQKVIMETKEELWQQLLDVEQTGYDAGLTQNEVFGCTFSPRRALDVMAGPLASNIMVCTSARTTETVKNIDEAFTSLDRAVNSVAEYSESIDSCRAENVEVCALTVMVHITNQNAELSTTLLGGVGKVLDLFAGVEASFQECTVSSTNDMVSRGGAIIDQITLCVNEKIATANEATIINFVVDPSRDVFAEAESQHQEFAQTIENAVTHATDVREETQNEVKILGQSVSVAGQKVIMETKEKLWQQLLDIEQTGYDAGLTQNEVFGCTFSPRRALDVMAGPLAGDITICTSARTTESSKTLDEAFLNLDRAVNSVTEYAASIEKCRAENAEVCALTVMVHITNQNAALHTTLRGGVGRALNLFADIGASFQECTVSPTNDMVSRGGAIINQSALCVNNKIASISN